MRYVIRRFRLPLITLAAVLTMAGCADGPGKVGAAAVVGDTSISVDSVQRDFQWLLDNIPDAKRLQEQKQMGSISRYALQVRIRHQLIAETARELDVSADPADVDDLLERVGGAQQAQQQLLITPDKVREFLTDIVLLREIGRHYVDRLSVKVAGTLIAQEAPGETARDRAVALGKAMAAEPERAAELATQGDQPMPNELVLSEVVGGAEGVLAQTPLFAVEEGTVLVMQPDPQQGAVWLVALVQERSDSATGAAGGEYSDDVLEQVGLQLLRPAAEELGVRVNPRYGVWDEAGMNIVDEGAESSGLLLPARGTEQ